MIRNKLIYGMWALLLGGVCFFRTDPFLLILLGLTLLLVPLSAAASRFLASNITILLEAESSTDGGNSAECRIRFRYNGILPFIMCRGQVLCENKLTADVEVIKCLAACAKGCDGHVSIQMKSKYCGKIEIKLEECMIWDSLGLIGFRKKCEEKKAVLMVPQAVDIDLTEEVVNIPDMEGIDYSEEKAGFDPSETFSIRDYKEGDRMKSIHWKLSYKLDRIMVRDPGLPVKNSTQILMETCFNAEDEERKRLADAVCAFTISLSELLVDAGTRHQLGWMDYKENVFRNYEINSADNLIEILGELLGTTAVSGSHSVNDKFYEETGCQEIPGLVIINHDRI